MHNIKASWDKINPDEAARRRMLGRIMDRTHTAEQPNEGGNLMLTRKKYLRTALIAVALACILAVSVFAAVKLLTAREVAEWLDPEIAKAFHDPGAMVIFDAVEINETQTAGDYEITLLGIAPARNFSVMTMIADGKPVTNDTDQVFAAIALRRKDGTPMPDDLAGLPSFSAWPLIQGVDPRQHLIGSGGGIGSVRDGVLYYLFNCNDLFPFADRQVFLSVSDQGEWSGEQYLYDEATGNHSPNPAYKGVCALFKLPLDKSKADPVRAAELLEKSDIQTIFGVEAVPNAFLEALSGISLEKCTLLEDSVKPCVPDAEGKISYSYSYESEDYAGSVDVPDRNVSEMEFDAQGYSQERFYAPYAGENLFVGAFHRDETGKITAMMWLVPEKLVP
jgi:hypothetical protein